MKRWDFVLCVAALLAGCAAALSCNIWDPSDFTGKWYYADDLSAYLFHNGIIISEKHHVPTSDDEIFSGAYTFSRDSILLFIVGSDGVEEVHELKMRTDAAGDQLCMADTHVPVFYRNKDSAAHNEIS